MAAADPVPAGVTTHKMERSLRALTVTTQNVYKAAAVQREQISAGEYMQQGKLEIAGTAKAWFEWIDAEIEFPEPFIESGDRRFSDFKRPHFTFGYEITTRDPIVVTAYVTSWVGAEGETTGAKMVFGVWIGDHTDEEAEVKFRGTVHVSFQGFAYPVLLDDDG
jgi:hypothetical protein